MAPSPRFVARCALVGLATLIALPARALPAFARKYGTSCLTCHSVYPKLTPFGEAFRRNGYRFPGIDSDFVKQETVPLGQEANKKTFPRTVWPATIPASVPLAIGFNGQANLFPDKSASVPRASKAGGGAATFFSFDDAIAEAHIWMGAALGDTLTTWGELTLASDGGASLEHAQLLFEDLLGPKHLVNVVVGKGFPTLTPFGPHSSFAADLAIPNLPVTGIYGLSQDPFVLVDDYTGAEVNGVAEGRLQYAAGVSNGKNTSGASFNSENAYGSAAYKLGGMRLDGEGDTGPRDAMRPWAEESLTVNAFVYRSTEHFPAPGGSGASTDTSLTVGGTLRAMYGSSELDLGYYAQSHDHGTDALDRVRSDAIFGELSYVVFPWLVPTLRVERVALRPRGGKGVSDLHLMPALAFLIRPDVKLVVAANIESASGYPSPGGAPVAWDGGSGDSGVLVAAPTGADPGQHRTEFESITFFLAWAL